MDLIARRACLVLENKVSILFFCYFQNGCLYYKKIPKKNTETSYILIFGQIILSLPGILRFWLLNMTVVMTSFEFRVWTIQKGGKAFITVRVLQWMNDLPVKTFRKGSICLSAVLDCILFMVFCHVFYFADQGFLVLTYPLSVYLSWKWAFYHEIYAIVEGSQGNSRFKSKWRFQKLSSEFNKHHMTKFSESRDTVSHTNTGKLQISR